MIIFWWVILVLGHGIRRVLIPVINYYSSSQYPPGAAWINRILRDNKPLDGRVLDLILLQIKTHLAFSQINLALACLNIIFFFFLFLFLVK
jgi:hypothetical protein